MCHTEHDTLHADDKSLQMMRYAFDSHPFWSYKSLHVSTIVS